MSTAIAPLNPSVDLSLAQKALAKGGIDNATFQEYLPKHLAHVALQSAEKARRDAVKGIVVLAAQPPIIPTYKVNKAGAIYINLGRLGGINVEANRILHLLADSHGILEFISGHANSDWEGADKDGATIIRTMALSAGKRDTRSREEQQFELAELRDRAIVGMLTAVSERFAGVEIDGRADEVLAAVDRLTEATVDLRPTKDVSELPELQIATSTDRSARAGGAS